MDAGAYLGYALGSVKLADAAYGLWREWRDDQAPRADPVAEAQGSPEGEEVDTVSKRSVKVTVEVFPGRTTQTIKVFAAGRFGSLLLGKVRRQEFRAPLTTAATEQLYVSAVLTAANALVLS